MNASFEGSIPGTVSDSKSWLFFPVMSNDIEQKEDREILLI